ncbi:IS200/IS605 family element transposase accessory protein TnpB [Aceticella autotrophica]|uniref:IS200/IS605 family element transposase accessory protein TnpB n=1 Tax=Aceticella autotrophica TaxID=2755338 RepID=A0A974Y2T8_9THEO|nr:IS200/IS605 family accessory protein TnpB-related protein [Aceticella autotrophica]QSZ26496.1 IS200/IS605 family element transposase accessory protein TnpB [Aceticella autotrophica]
MKKGKKNKNKSYSLSGEISCTVCGEFFPEVYPAFRLKKWSRGMEDPLKTEMRLFCSCMRWAFNRLQEDKSREELKKECQQVFGLNSRCCDDAILKGRAIIESQKELLKLEIEETKTKLSRAKKKLRQAEKTLDKAVEKNDPEKIKNIKHTVHGRKARVKKLSDKLSELFSHQDNDTVPTVVFGGHSLWKKVCKGRIPIEEWRKARQDRLYSRGDKTKGGNPNIKISEYDGEFFLSVTISHLSEQKGTDIKGRPVMTRAPRVEGRLWLPDKYRSKVYELLLSRAPYTVELIKGKDDRYRAHISFVLTPPDLTTNPDYGYLGMDTNPDGIALANVGCTGQPEPWLKDFEVPYPKALHKFDGEFLLTIHPNGFLYIKIPELAYSRGYRRTYLIGVLAKVIVDIAKALGKPIALEKLDFGKDHLDTNKKFNRMAANFPFRKIVEAVIRRAFKEGVGVKQVWPAHTSTIGYWKYKKKYGIIIHHAAALVIARRAIGFKERFTNELKQKIQVLKEKLNQKANSLPGEGRGMTRKVKQLFKKLDGKILKFNGLTRFKQESFYSVWHDLKQLALSSR